MRKTIIGLLCAVLMLAGCASTVSTSDGPVVSRTSQKVSVLITKRESPIADAPEWYCAVVHIPVTAKYCLRRDVYLSRTDNTILFRLTSVMSDDPKFGPLHVYEADATMWLPPTAGDAARHRCAGLYNDWRVSNRAVYEACAGLVPGW